MKKRLILKILRLVYNTVVKGGQGADSLNEALNELFKDYEVVENNSPLPIVSISEAELEAFTAWYNNLSVEEFNWYDGKYIETFKSL